MIKLAWKSPVFAFFLLAIALFATWLTILLLTGAAAEAAAIGPAGPLWQVADEVEPNDTPAQANSIALNQTMQGRIPLTNTADIDFFVLTTQVGGVYEVRLDEQPPSGNYRLNLALYNGSERLIEEDDTSTAADAVIQWTADDTTYYFSVEAPEIFEDAKYRLRAVFLGVTPEPPEWDSCEINDSLTGTWSDTTPPGGPCPISVGALVSDLNFVGYTGWDENQKNPDYFVVWVKAGRRYALETSVTAGVDTEAFLYLPGATDDSQYIARDDDGGVGRGSRIEWTPASDGNYLIKIVNLEPLPHESTETYNLSVQDVTPTPAPTATPGTPTATATPIRVPGTPDAFEPNWDFDVASLIGLGVKYANLNFVPWGGRGVDNDFYKVWVTAGKLYTCETLDLGDATNTNMILYSCPSQECGFAGNDDVQPFDPVDPYRSRITFFSSYTGYLYVLLGQVGVEQILPGEWANLSYSLQCYIDLPGTATPTPTSPYVPPSPQPTFTPQLTSPPGTPVPTPTPVVLVVVPMTTPAPPPPPPPVVTPTPQLYVIEVVVYYDRNANGRVDPGEGVVDALARAYDAITGELLSIDYTDETGFMRFTFPSSRPVRISVPYFGFQQIVTTTSASIEIRISPLP